MGSEEAPGTTSQLLEGLPSKNLEALWPKMAAMAPARPNPTAKPCLWKYKDVLPDLLQAGKLVPAESAERRVLMLVNPAMEAPYTTDTIYGGLQLVNPGETAAAHRHIAYALRFIIQGNGFTAVEGKKLPLSRGDIVLTPTWQWHDHGNESNGPVIWLDILNLPLFQYAPVHFAEGYSEGRYPSKLCESSDWRFPWKPVQEALDAEQKQHSVYHYRDGVGKHLSSTLGAQAERISPGKTTNWSQESTSFVYHCYEGNGRTIIEPPSGEQIVFSWTTGDTFAVPAWSRLQHTNESADHSAYLFAANDRPFLDILGLRRPNAE